MIESTLDALLEKAFPPPPPIPAHAVEDSVRRLESSWVPTCLARDPYWPKWDSPWWHMVLLWELGLSERIPSSALHAMVEAIDRHYLHHFPIVAGDVPAGVDPTLGGMCHCGLATMYRVLTACGVKVDGAMPWARLWFTRYQLPDGGFNCDEGAYLRDAPHSSFVSTLPVLEAILYDAPSHSPLTDEEERALDRGADYLAKRRLCRSLSRGGTLVDATWLLPCFPRFYEYDVLRGLAWLVDWTLHRGCGLPMEAVVDALEAIAASAGRDFTSNMTTRAWMEDRWDRMPSTSFPLLDAVRGRKGHLHASWRDTAAGLRRLRAMGQLAENGKAS